MFLVRRLIPVFTEIQLEAKKLSKKVQPTVINLKGKISLIIAMSKIGMTQTKVFNTCNKKDKAPTSVAGNIRDSIIHSVNCIILGIVYAFLLIDPTKINNPIGHK